MNGENGKLERLRQKLYSKTARPRQSERSELYADPQDVSESWEGGEQVPVGAEALAEESDMGKKRKQKWYTSLTWWLIIAAGFFIVSIALAGAFLFFGETFVSAKNVEITVEGPSSIAGGDTLELEVTVTNNNDTPLELADLIVEYPEGTRSADDLNREHIRERESLGTVAPGESVTKNVKAVLFGEQGSTKKIALSVEYRVPNSNAIFFTEGSYEVGISSAPLAMRIEGLDEVVSDKEVVLTVTVSSNAESVIENVLLRGEFPFGFAFKSATPNPAFSDNIWTLGDIQPGGERVVKVRGTLTGEDEEERVFRFSSGVQSDADERALSAAFITGRHEVVLKRPFIGLDLVLNGDASPTYIANSGETIRADITWQNNTTNEIRDAEIAVELTGAALNRSSVSVQNGFYNSNTDTITWSSETLNELSRLSPGSAGRASFTFAPKHGQAASALRNPAIDLRASISGRRLSESQQVPEAVDTTLTKQVQVAADLALSARGVHSVGPFQNEGALPPSAEQLTTYTIIWTVTNTANTVSNITAKATLPSYVEWRDRTDPSSADISFNPVGGSVTWDVGTLRAGERQEVAFQIGLTPSVSQIGTRPTLVSDQRVTGFDQFIEEGVSRTATPISTSISTDPAFTQSDATVTE